MTSSSEAIPRCQECGQELWKLDGRTIYGNEMWMHARHNAGPWKRTKHPPKPPVDGDAMTSSSDRSGAARLAEIEAFWKDVKARPFAIDMLNAELTAHCLEDVPWLLARLQEVEAENERLKAEIARIAEAGKWLAMTAAQALDTNPLTATMFAEEHGVDLAKIPMVHTTAVDYAEVTHLRALNRKQEEVIAGAYRERNAIAAALGRLFPSWVGTDADEPDWPVLYINLPTGQVSWHYASTDADLLTGIARGTGVWDGHTTEEKYARLAALAASRVTGEEQEA